MCVITRFIIVRLIVHVFVHVYILESFFFQPTFRALCQSCFTVVATVYSWTFDPPFDHALKGCSYFGQTKQAFEARTSQHKNDSVRKPKELGLLFPSYVGEDIVSIVLKKNRIGLPSAKGMGAPTRR